MGVDLVLSSGFLAFAAQAGVLRAVEECGIEVDAVCGTSSGALAGSLWVAGMPAEEIFTRLTASAPLRRVRPSATPWRGLLSMAPVIRELEADLPAAFSDLGRPFAVGVIDPSRTPRLLSGGPLPRAVAASCAIPGLFGAVEIDGQRFADGGVVDRLGLGAWRALRPHSEVVVHVVDRSSGGEEADLEGLRVIRSPRSGAQLWSLGDARARYERARAEATSVLRGL
ncbi:MAG: patatin-like phospholipase family protein [Myxococcota bacterium]